MSSIVREIYNFSQKPLTPFAPSWNYYIAEGNVTFDLQDLKNEILTKEKEIIERSEFVDDWGTKLGRDSLTSRSNTYNLLEFDHAQDLKKSIKHFHDIFVERLDLPEENSLYCQCWANVMRKKQKIASHFHGFGPTVYLSGHLCLQVKDTHTYYSNPYHDDSWKSKNIDGKITMFPSWVRHYTDSVKDDDIRITLAFDIMPEKSFYMDVCEEMRYHWVEL
jgi:hypothetical protein